MTKSPNLHPHALLSKRTGALHGTIIAPPDKSISHRALLFGSQRIGILEISHLLESEDVLGTMAALQRLGIRIEQEDKRYIVYGNGIGGLHEPSGMLDMGNSGTGARLLMGLVSSYPFSSFFSGDDSLCKRPMGRVLTPLSQSGMTYTAATGDRLPLVITGSNTPLPIAYESPVASAQVKSAVLLAGLNIAGKTTLIESTPTRDHTEIMAQHFGFAIQSDQPDEQKTIITVTGKQQPPRSDATITVPGDPSSAAFPVVAALITPESELTIQHMCTNRLRVGLYHWLEKMGANLAWQHERQEAGESIADLHARFSQLKGIDIPADAAASMIDEYPILAVAASYAEGTTVMRGLDELRVKESDRLQAVYDGLIANGIQADIQGDDLIIHGTGGNVPGGGRVTTHYDHRIAMSFLVMGLASEQPISVDDGRAIATSFPNFRELMSGIGAFIIPERREIDRIGMDRRLVIAIDGPAASGKGTLARRLSRHLNLPYLDTGTLYRAVGLRLVSDNLDPDNEEHAIDAARRVSEQDLSDPALRQETVGQAASIISAMPQVRKILLDYQRQFASAKEGAILDGRDIGTVVCPDADVKIFMTASLETRAKRRHEQLQGEGLEVVYDSVLKGLAERDKRDEERQSAPLKAAQDAVSLDTTDLTIDEVFAEILELLREKNIALAKAS